MAMHHFAHRRPLPDGTQLLNDPEHLHAFAQTEGVVLLRGLIPIPDLIDVRQVLSNAATAAGWLPHGKGLAGVVESVTDPMWKTWYRTVQCARSFHALPHLPAMQSAMRAVLGAEVLTHPRHIARCVGPGTAAFTTPPHQDVWYIGGTPNFWTAWMPLSDCPEALGGLAVVPRSHRQGLLPNRAANGAGGRGIAGALSDTWAWEPLKAGDVIVFHGQTMHQGCDNKSEDLRFSIDLRFQRIDEAVREDSLRPHYDLMSWDDIYRTWPADDALRYYWQRQHVRVVDL